MRNAGGDRFELRVQNPSGAPAPPTAVHWVVVEAGVYTQAADGITLEATTFSSSLTDENDSWSGEPRGYQQAYTSPIVLGQVMSAHDADWSILWASDGNPVNPPSATTLHVGKHVAEDTDAARADETIGYIVVEAGTGVLGAQTVEAGLTADTIQGATNGAPFTAPIGVPDGTAVLSTAGMDGNNGGWPVHYQAPAQNALELYIEEDQIADSERGHITEQAAYLVIRE